MVSAASAATVNVEGVDGGLYGGDRTVVTDGFAFEALDNIFVGERGLTRPAT